MRSTASAALYQVEQLYEDLQKLPNHKTYAGIVLHTASEFAEDDNIHQAFAIDAYYQKRYHEPIGYGCVVERDGTIYITERMTRALRQRHCHARLDGKLVDKTLIGICLAGHGDIQRLTPIQKQQVQRLVEALSATYAFGMHRCFFHSYFVPYFTCPGIEAKKDLDFLG